MMDWRRLLTTKRLGADRLEPITADRSPFDIDMDRLTYAPAFRRLADKMQVHGTAGNDMVRTRLTHSLEAARVGRSLGATVGRIIVQRTGLNDVTAADIGAIVACAAAAHDIGTPPFGHQGEDVVSEWFQRSPLGRELVAGLPETERLELDHLEGNAHGFRLLAHLQGWRKTGGLQLTCATLGAFTKYPWGVEHRTAKGKYGHFASEAALFAEVAEACGLAAGAKPGTWARHPLAHLVEAADDICYTIADVEDGVSMGCLSYAEAETLLMPLAGPAADFDKDASESRKIGWLRSHAVGELVAAAGAAFLAHHDEILEGTFKGPLVEKLPQTPHLRRIIAVSAEKLYRGGSRVATDIAACKTLTTLLNAHCGALLDRETFEAEHGRDAKLPATTRAILQLAPDLLSGPRERGPWLRNVVDYVAGMTDSFAIEQAAALA